MAQNDADFIDEFDLDIRIWDGGSFGSLLERLVPIPPNDFMVTSAEGGVTCTCWTCRPVCRNRAS